MARRPSQAQRVFAVALVAGALAALILAVVYVRHERAAHPFASSPKPLAAEPFRRIDVHTHLMVGSLPQLTMLMDRYGFEHVVDLSGGTPDTNLEAHLAQARASGGRITVFMTLPGYELHTPGYGERIASMLVRAHEMGARGFKITKALGLGHVDYDERRVPVDDPGLDAAFEAAGRLGMPVAIHTADPKAFWEPPDEKNERWQELRVHPKWSFFDKGLPSWSAMLDELERRIARHPNTTFIAVHFGCAAEEPDRVARMLRKYPNLYIDTAARFPEFGRHPSAQMRAFFLEFQDRILYGTDLGVGVEPLDIVPGSSGEDLPTTEDIDRFFRSSFAYLQTTEPSIESPTPIQGDWEIHGIGLPADVLEKIYAKNAERLLR